MATEWIEWAKVLGSNAAKFYKLHHEVERLKTENASLKDQLATSQKNEEQLRNQPSVPNAEFVGWYNDSAGLMPQITLFLKEIEEKHPGASITIALDFAAYGAITWNGHFSDQERIITSLSKRGAQKANPLIIIVNSSSNNKSVIESQYTDAVYRKGYMDLFKKLESWVASDLFQVLAAREENQADVDAGNTLEKLRGAVNSKKQVSKSLFITSFIKFNERLLDRYRDAGANVVVRDNLVPLHGWFYYDDQLGDTEGIIGIVDIKAVWNEPGFRVRNDVSRQLKKLIDQFARTNNGT